jgi:putative endonuclease
MSFNKKDTNLFHVKENKKLQIVNKIGRLGEDLACKFLENKGFSIIDRNYRENWGEIDIVARKGLKLSFFEIKSVSCVTDDLFSQHKRDDQFKPEDNVSEFKLKKMARIIQTYLFDKKVSSETDWDFNILAVFIDKNIKKAYVRLIENVF